MSHTARVYFKIDGQGDKWWSTGFPSEQSARDHSSGFLTEGDRPHIVIELDGGNILPPVNEVEGEVQPPDGCETLREPDPEPEE